MKNKVDIHGSFNESSGKWNSEPLLRKNAIK